jgi:glycosyltransferase involved in cell wall biosynthesis
MPFRPDLRVALLTGGQDRHYACGLAMALVSAGVCLDVVGGDSEDGPEMHGNDGLHFFNLHGSHQKASLTRRIERILACYLRLTRYAWKAKPPIFHILWNNKFQLFDRTLLMLYYRLLGKKIVLTAHNVNDGRRDAKDSLLNRLTLQFQYRLAHHIFVHTEKMKKELLEQFHVSKAAVTIIPYGINNAVPDTGLTYTEAKKQLGLRNDEKTLLFFGAIKPYKGLEYLVAAFQTLAPVQPDIRLIIAGERKKGHEQYWSAIQQRIDTDPSRDRVTQKIGFIPDDETELYFKAADVAVLPYTEIFQSGILFLAYSFGLPVIATDVGSFAEDIVEDKTGCICKPRDPDALAAAIQNYFNGALFRELEHRRQEIREYTRSKHSWTVVGGITRHVYADLLAARR